MSSFLIFLWSVPCPNLFLFSARVCHVSVKVTDKCAKCDKDFLGTSKPHLTMACDDSVPLLSTSADTGFVSKSLESLFSIASFQLVVIQIVSLIPPGLILVHEPSGECYYSY